MNLPPDHARLLERIEQHVVRDGRFDGLAAGGSMITGGLDEYSDLDLVLVVRDEHHAAVMAQRRQVAERWMPLLAAFTGEHVGEPRLLICLCADPLLHVDLKFVTLEEFGHRIEDPLIIWEREDLLSGSIAESAPVPLTFDPQWAEDRFWTWVHYAATKLGRGELFEVLEFLGFVRARVIAPMAKHARGLTPRGVRRVEQQVPELVAPLSATVAVHDRAACADAVRACVDLYRALREELPVPTRRRVDAEAAAVGYLGEVEARGRDA